MMTTGMQMFRWQIAEYLSLVYLFPMVAAANIRRPRVVEERIPFGPHPQQYVLFCRPPERGADALLFFAPGGGWRTGSPSSFRFIGRFFAERGFPTVVAGYRLAPKFRFPAQAEDVYAGLQAGIQAARQYGLSANKILLGGQSAGAHLVSLLAYNRGELARHGLAPSLFAGMLLISGPLNFSVCTNRTITQLVNDFVGDPANKDKADPMCHVQGDQVFPVLCVHGACDPLVDVRNSISFADQINRAGTQQAQVHILQGGHHSDLVALFLRDLPATRFLTDWLTDKVR
jgi:acetyl esterase/lipase